MATNGKAAAAAAKKAGGAAGTGKSSEKAAAGPIGSKNSSKSSGGSTANVLDQPLISYPVSSKPDREEYNREQEAVKAQLNAKQAQLDKLKARIAESSGQGPAGERRKALRAEQQEIRAKTASFKDGRNNAFGQMKILQENVQKKIKDMNNAKSKTSFKSVEEIDGRIKELEKQVESGTLRLKEEKEALKNISDLRRARKSFDTFGSAQEGIDSDKAKIDELKKQLDEPEYKALNNRYTAIQEELDGLSQELESSNRDRDRLFDERRVLNDEVNALWTRKKESAGNFKEANDKYYTRVNEERSKRIAKQQAERREYEEGKRREVAEKMLEEARHPAFEREIEDCTTLISYFSRYQSGATSVPEPKLQTTTEAASGGSVANVPALEVRKVEDDIPQGAVMMKKKGEDQESYFAVNSGKGKKRGGAKGGKAAAPEKENNAAMNIPFQTVAALLQFDIQTPLSREDVPKTIDALREKQTWFKDNQDRVTKERIEKAEKQIRKAEESSSGAGKENDTDATADADESKANGVAAANGEEETAGVAVGVEKLAVSGEETST